MGSQHWEVHRIPPHLTEELFPGLTYEEALQDQETLYEALKIIGSDPSAILSSSGGSNGQEHGQASRTWEESYLSEDFDINSQLALDEALAISLQELEDGIDSVSISEPILRTTNGGDGNSSANVASSFSSANISAGAASNASAHPSSNASASSTENFQDTEDDIDPDHLTYEELQSLGEAIGSESKGLSEDAISSLPIFKYKSGIFSRKSKAGECAICYSKYENKQYVTALPCVHQYHSECIKRWLRQSKSCPICQVEVNLSS